MTNSKKLQLSFAGGEVSPWMRSRLDTPQYQTGADLMRNFYATPTGAAVRRPGFRISSPTKASVPAQLLRFLHSTTDAVALEFAVGYFRLHVDGAPQLYAVPPDFVPNQAIISVSLNKLNFTNPHGLSPSDPVVVYTSVAPPAGLVAGVVYYVHSVTSSTSVKLAATPGGPELVVTTAGTGAGLTRAYEAGDLVKFGAAHYYCVQRPWFADAAPIVPGAAPAYWYQLPINPNIYEIPHSYTVDQLFEVSTAQSFDVLTIAHSAHPVRELRRYGATKWVLQDVTFEPPLSKPTGLQATKFLGVGMDIQAIADVGGEAEFETYSDHGFFASDTVHIGVGTTVGSAYLVRDFYVIEQPTATKFRLRRVLGGETVLAADLAGAPGAYTPKTLGVRFVAVSSETSNTYVLTALDDAGIESRASAPLVVADNNLLVAGAYNTITWTAVTGAQFYHVYKQQTGLFGFIGRVDATATLSFKDDNIAPDLGVSPPLTDVTLSGSDHPRAVGYFEQRRVFASTPTDPLKVWMTRSGTESALTYSLPIQDSDRIAFRVAAREGGVILHILPLEHLLLMGSTAEYRATPINTDALTPGSVAVRTPSYVGSTSVPPAVINRTVLFCGARGGHVYELGYDLQPGNFRPGDVSLRASHLFDGFEVVGMGMAKAPYPILWAVSSSGLLLGFTYLPHEQIGAWHSHDTAGLFEAACVIPEGDEDRLYVVVNRDGVRTVERMGVLTFASLEDSYHVDSGVTYDGAGTSEVNGLGHLEGREVQILADGFVQPPLTVRGGTVLLDVVAAKIHVGLPITSTLRTLPVVAPQAPGAGQGATKNANRAWVRTVDSARFQVGPGDVLTAALPASGVHSTEVRVTLPGDWTDGGQITIQESEPVPVTVTGVVLELAPGG